jgi:hypothetical protein
VFGASSDLQIYHDGFNSYIQDTQELAILYFRSAVIFALTNATGTQTAISSGLLMAVDIPTTTAQPN